MRAVLVSTLAFVLTSSLAEARVVRLRIERREVVLERPLVRRGRTLREADRQGRFRSRPQRCHANGDIVDLKLAPRNARGEVESSADFYMLKPVDPRRGNGRLFYEVGNRGGKAMLSTFQKATGSPDPTTEAEFGDGALMRRVHAALDGMAMGRAGAPGHDADGDADRHRERPPNHREWCAATSSSTSARRQRRSRTAITRPYPVLDPNSAENVMTVRDDPIARGDRSSRDSRWRFVDAGHGRPRRRLRARPHLRRRVSHQRPSRPRVRARRHARPRQLHEVRHVGGQSDRPAFAPRSAGACRRAAAFCGIFSTRASTRTSRGARCSTACSIRSAARAAGRSTTDSARRRATRSSTSTSCSRSICSRSPTGRQPIPKAA